MRRPKRLYARAALDPAPAAGRRHGWARPQIQVVTAGLALATGAGGAAAATGHAQPVSGPVRQVPQAPSNATAPRVLGTAQDGAVLNADPGGWTGAQPLAFVFQWERCDTHGSSCTPIADARSRSYVLAAGDAGATVRVVVRASNLGGTSAPTYSVPTGIVNGSSIVNVEPPALEGRSEAESSLTVEPGRWQAPGPVELRYKWRRCRQDRSSCIVIAGAGGSTYSVRAQDAGSRLTAWVTAVAGGTSVTRQTAFTAVVRPRPARAALMRPVPRVRISGDVMGGSTRLTLVSVTSPKGAQIAVACRGDRCPSLSSTTSRSAGGPVRLPALETSLAAGTRLEIRVTKPPLVGKYTSILMRNGQPPSRRDRCLMPNSTLPVPCPGR